MIKFANVSKYYDARGAAVENLSLSIATGEFLALAGPSGSGKTTTLSMINRLVEPSSGAVFIDGINTRTADPVALRRQIGFVFQDVGLFPHMTVAENVGIALRLAGRPASDIAVRVDELLALVRLRKSFRDVVPATLSGGQRQRVGVARALAANPRIVLMDEPFGALDAITREELAGDYRSIHDRLGLTTVLVTHDMIEAMLLADRVALMREGKLVQVGTPRALYAMPADDFVRAMIDSPRRRAARLASMGAHEA